MGITTILTYDWFWDVILFSLMVLHILTCPYTKVEESFNVQATHDIIFQLPLNEVTFLLLHSFLSFTCLHSFISFLLLLFSD